MHWSLGDWTSCQVCDKHTYMCGAVQQCRVGNIDRRRDVASTGTSSRLLNNTTPDGYAVFDQGTAAHALAVRLETCLHPSRRRWLLQRLGVLRRPTAMQVRRRASRRVVPYGANPYCTSSLDTTSRLARSAEKGTRSPGNGMGGERTVEDVSRPASFQAGNPPSSSRTSLKPNARYIHQQRAALIEYCVTEVIPWRQA